MTVISSQNTLKHVIPFLSTDTEFIHLSYAKRPFLRADSIPLYHNFLYVHMLFNTKQRAEMEKAMELLKRLYHFQVKKGEQAGHFPRYLHQYPYVERRFEIVDILLPLYQIYRNFGHIFNKELKEKTDDVLIQAVKSLYVIVKEESFSGLLSLQMSALLIAYGTLFEKDEWQALGIKSLNNHLANGPQKTWGSTRHLSKMILYLGLIREDERVMNQNSFWNYLHQVWHSDLCAYQGPGLNEHYYEDLPEMTLYHYYMHLQYETLLPTLFDADMMEVALLPKPSQNASFVPQQNLDFFHHPFNVHLFTAGTFSYTFFNLDKSLWEKRGGFYPLKIMLKKDQSMDHFLLQMGSYCQIRALDEKTLELFFDVQNSEELDVSFLCNLSSNVQITSKQAKASMFDLQEPIKFQFQNHTLCLSLSSSCEGMWGQLLWDNKRSQMIKSFNHTYDWRLYIRSAHHKLSEPLKFLLQIEHLK